MIAIIDYGMGNLRSVQKGFESQGCRAEVTSDPAVIERASGVVLPGVGSFKACAENLKSYGLVDSVYGAIRSGRPFLGICVGLQLLFSESEEFGISKGLDVIPGKVVRFPERFKVPHMGWNRVHQVKPLPIMSDVPQDTYFYFVHSYYVVPADDDAVATTTDYHLEFTSAVWRDNVFGVQFHPEKSQEMGLRILKTFGVLCGER